MLENGTVANHVSLDDLQERFRNVWLYASKAFSEFSDDDLEQYLDYFFGQPETYQFFFPHGVFNLPDGYEIGLCVVHDFDHLPANLREHLIEDWGYRFEREKSARGPKTKEEYEAARKREMYFCTDVKALGYGKAMEVATRIANQSLNIIKTLYIIDVKKLTRCFWIAKTGIGGYDTEFTPQEPDWYRYKKIPELEGFVATLSNMIRKEDTSELARRCLSAVDIFGMIERETPLEVRFLLSVIPLEGILLGKNDKDYLGMKLREKVTILLGDTPYWLRTCLGKESPTEEERSNNRVPARIELAKRISEMYGKRSGFAHADDEPEKVTESDCIFASEIFRLTLQRILSLYEKEGINRIAKKNDTLDKKSLDYFIESLKYSAPLGWQ